MAIITLVNHIFKNSQLAVAMKNAALLPAAGFGTVKKVYALFSRRFLGAAHCVFWLPQ